MFWEKDIFFSVYESCKKAKAGYYHLKVSIAKYNYMYFKTIGRCYHSVNFIPVDLVLSGQIKCLLILDEIWLFYKSCKNANFPHL